MESEPMRVLLVEDSQTSADLVRVALRQTAAELPTEVMAVGTIRDATAALAESLFDVVLMNLTLADSAGLGSLRTVRAQNSDVPVIVLATADTIEAAAAAVRMGANDFILKHPQNLVRIPLAIRNAVHHARLAAEHRKLVKTLTEVLPEALAKVRAYGNLISSSLAEDMPIDEFDGAARRLSRAAGELIEQLQPVVEAMRLEATLRQLSEQDEHNGQHRRAPAT